jgi:hypothetical protein
MDIFSIGAVLLALAVLASIAFPDLLLPSSDKKRKVGCSYWGVYEGAATDEPEDAKTIEIETPIGKEKVVAGSAMYAMGRGTSFRM